MKTQPGDFVGLYYFGADEFVRGEQWFYEMDPRLLVLLDVFRYQWHARSGQGVIISPHPKALGRYDGAKLSDHNVELHNQVQAADVMPLGMNHRSDAEAAVGMATDCCFTAIGFYPDWNPHPGLHLGVRYDRQPGDPHLWGGIRPDPEGEQEYVTLTEALERLSG